MSKLEIKASPYMYTDEEIASVGKPEPDEPMDYSYPDGFFKLVNCLDYIPDTKMRIAMVAGLMKGVPNI